MPKRRRPPRYLRHSARNLGYFRIDGKQIYFPGPWNSAESLAAYEEGLAEWRMEADREKYPYTIADLVVNDRMLIAGNFSEPTTSGLLATPVPSTRNKFAGLMSR